MSNEKQATKKTEVRAPGFVHVRSREYIHEYTLKANGMRVLIVDVPGSPTVTTNIVYHVGSKDEAYGETGLAHMLEHMLFKPTHTKGLAWKALEDKGAVLNATTWLDRTLYYFNLPAEYLDEMLAVEADRMRNLTITDEEFYPERANVLSEFEMHNSNPNDVLEWAMLGAAFQSHGYKHDTIGFREDIEACTTEKLKAFYDQYYWPNNATLIIAGDVSHKQTLALVREHFEAIPGNFDPLTRPNAKEPVQEGVRRVEIVRTTPIRTFTIAYKAPAFTERAWTSLMLALQHLTLGETSPLHRALVDTNLASNVDAHIMPTHLGFLAMIVVSATANASYEKIESIIDAAIANLHAKPLSKSELLLLTTYNHAQELMSRDGAYSIATQIAEYVATGDWERFFTGLTELTSITPKEVQEAARTYLTKTRATIGTIKNA